LILLDELPDWGDSTPKHDPSYFPACRRAGFADKSDWTYCCLDERLARTAEALDGHG
jgi:hypothetical protein